MIKIPMKEGVLLVYNKLKGILEQKGLNDEVCRYIV